MPALRILFFSITTFCLASLPAVSAVSQDVRTPNAVTPLDDASATRLIPLYYTRDAEKVIGFVRDRTESPPRVSESPQADRIQGLELERQRLQSLRTTLLEQRAPSASRLLDATNIVPQLSSPADDDLATIERNIALLDGQEQTFKAAAFREESQQRAPSRAPFVSEALETEDAVDRVRISVVGEGQLYLRGPLVGVNAITRMVHEIDQPVGQVKIGFHIAQFTGMNDAAMEDVHGDIERHLGHARQLSQVSQMLLRAAFSNVAARYRSAHQNQFEEAFLYMPCVRHFRSLHGPNASLSIALLDSRDVVTTLLFVSLATNQARREILTEFRHLAAAELPRMHEHYQRALDAAQHSDTTEASILRRLTHKSFHAKTNPQPVWLALDLSFRKTTSLLEPVGDHSDSANAVQVATTRFQRAVLELRRGEAAVTAMRNDRRLVELKSSHGSSPAHFRTVSGELLDTTSFGRLADRVIEEQTASVLDLREIVRSEVATLDGQLKRLVTALEDDLRQQFYKPALLALRRSRETGDLRLDQIQTTTIRTYDRRPARVSPSQVAVLDRPVQTVLLQEGIQVAQGLAQEAFTLAQTATLQAASNAAVPGASSWLAQAGFTTVPGQRLEELVEPAERMTASVGDDIAVTPIIQPDGSSVAFHLLYAHTHQRTNDGKSPAPAGVQRHLVEADVQLASLELQEVSRFRVTLESDEQGKGIPLLQDVPVAGVLFRPRRSTAATVQENIILIDVVVYPTAMALAGKGWLAMETADPGHVAGPLGAAPAIPAARSELTGWVLQTLRHQAREGLSGTGHVEQAIHTSSMTSR